MWSRNARPVATLIRPRPARSTFATRRVSLLLRATSPFLALLFKPHLHGMRVRREPLQLREPHAGLAQHLEITSVQAEEARALHESVDAKRRTEPRCARPACGSRSWRGSRRTRMPWR